MRVNKITIIINKPIDEVFDFTTNPGGFSAADIYVIDGPTFWGSAYFP